MGKFILASREDLDSMISRRAGETKLGEMVQVIESDDWENSLKLSPARFVILGIPEDIGVRANHGIGGTQSLWPAALKAFLNVQSAKALTGQDIIVLGAFDFQNKLKASADMNVHELRDLVGYIDETVHPLITRIVTTGKVPIVVGGGHNNSFPLLKGASLVDDKPVNCINLDAHSDFRPMEGRHSGNGFRYAHREGYLDKYEIVGLHENYNSADVIAELVDDPDIHFSYYEDIFLREKLSFEQAVMNAISRTSGHKRCIELDLDCIEGVLSSAATPSGIPALHARRFVTWCGHTHPLYLHLTEGATELADGRKDPSTAKLVAYLITDFIKAYTEKRGFFD